jgi:WhiB family redox-sensing transcriptional regulator
LVEVSVTVQILPFANAVTDWRTLSLCRDTDPALFFPVGTTGAALDQIAAAKAVCVQCTVRTECLDFALDTNQDSGVWGGLSEEERRVIRRQRAAAARRHSSTA